MTISLGVDSIKGIASTLREAGGRGKGPPDGLDVLSTVGELDRNVGPASTMQVVDALVRADKDFDLIVFTGRGHGAGGSAHGVRRLRDFFVRHLLGVVPRAE